MLNVLALAVLPALILLFYTYQQDKMQREPVKMIVKGFFWGCLSVFCSFFISVQSMHLGLFPDEIGSFWDAFRTAFFGAAIPEETAKLFCLWMFLRKNPYFDERMDGIVYAVCVGMGFAAKCCENRTQNNILWQRWIDERRIAFCRRTHGALSRR